MYKEIIIFGTVYCLIPVVCTYCGGWIITLFSDRANIFYTVCFGQLMIELLQVSEQFVTAHSKHTIQV